MSTNDLHAGSERPFFQQAFESHGMFTALLQCPALNSSTRRTSTTLTSLGMAAESIGAMHFDSGTPTWRMDRPLALSLLTAVPSPQISSASPRLFGPVSAMLLGHESA